MAFQTQLSRLKHVFAFMLLINLKLVKMYTMIKTSKKYMKVNSGHPPTTYIDIYNAWYWLGLLYMYMRNSSKQSGNATSLSSLQSHCTKQWEKRHC